MQYHQALSSMPGFSVPDSEEFKKEIEAVAMVWKGLEGEILTKIAQTTKLEWRIELLPCYFVDGPHSWSDPLTVSLKPNTDWTIDVLTHELIHVNLSQEYAWPLIQKRWNEHLTRYSNESRVTAIHVAIHAIHAKMILDIFGPERLEQEIARTKDRNYTRAWDIVKNVGYEQVLSSLTMD